MGIRKPLHLHVFGSREAFILISLVIIFGVIPPLTGSGYILNMVIRIFLWTLLTQSWNLLSGYTGYTNIGVAAFYGLGAYIMGLSIVYGTPFIVALFMAAIIPSFLGLIIGGVSLRLRGTYFSITTLMILLIISNVFYNISSFIPRTTSEIWIPPIPMSIIGMSSILSYYFIFYVLFVVVTITTYVIEKSKLGYALKAVGEDEMVAEELGINTTKVKVIALMLGTIISGIAGALYGMYLSYIDVPIFFSTFLTFVVMYVAMLGGKGIWYGPIIGTLLYVPVDEAIVLLTNIPEYSRIFYGLLFVLVMLLMPDGVGGFIRKKIS
jgi:branched-chain amino acid transport system permease protein